MRILQLLASPNLEIDTLDGNGVTMLYYAIFQGKDYYLDSLLDSGADINFKYKFGESKSVFISK